MQCARELQTTVISYLVGCVILVYDFKIQNLPSQKYECHTTSIAGYFLFEISMCVNTCFAILSPVTNTDSAITGIRALFESETLIGQHV